ncbi:OmpA family protein [Acidipila rosea]|uniref:OmpA family protein n=1 Tax=Acidipila rosea TaxID=768535 RepID=A0A4R1L9S8_9BACT|nr:OmpA family protein [Acidipila rosea]TCK75095.1 OmpA family protein [Acidipila rosea]
MKTAKKTHLIPGAVTALLLAASLGVQAYAQSGSAQVQTGASANGASSASASQNSQTDSTTATGKPLETKSKEGFWGHMNPLARKKWVNRQLDPVKGRLNELDELQAKNANDIKDVDSRAQAGINKAQSAADQANQLATTASGTASQAQQTAQQATAQTSKLSSTVSNLDQYQKVNETEIAFRPGQTVLNTKAKDALDQLATQLKGQKGYVVEIEGYSHSRGQAGIQNSQHMADSVVRYLVEQHQVPVYRIHQVAMGNAPLSDSTGVSSKSGSVVRVVMMQNSLAALN